MMKVRYKGPSFGVDGLTDNKIYSCKAVENGNFRIVDDSDEDYLYSATKPGPCDDATIFGKWEVVEDDEIGTLKKAIYGKLN
ncbi:MAG: hypothetical protein ACLTM5_04285 [Dialister sp.]